MGCYEERYRLAGRVAPPLAAGRVFTAARSLNRAVGMTRPSYSAVMKWSSIRLTPDRVSTSQTA
jgi:hypothetical protein